MIDFILDVGKYLQKIYRVNAVNFNGTDFYVSTEFFESDREAVINWYRNHL